MHSSLNAKEQLVTDIQTQGVNLVDGTVENLSRRGGAGPSDHQAIVVEGTAAMVPVHTHSARRSRYTLARQGDKLGLHHDGIPVTDITFAAQPKFYALSTAEGIPYSQIATLHSTDVLATTVLQTCIRYENARKTCKFCAIGQSLANGKTIAHKRPEQLAEVAKAAVNLDGVKHMVMTTGTPASQDRGAKVLCESVLAVKAAVDIPIQVQCEPPTDFDWFRRLRSAGADALGMHVEVISPEVRAHIMPSKARITIDDYLAAFAAAVPIFGRGQVSTYILAGLGDSVETILAFCTRLIDLGVYPFVVPFVPIKGTLLENHPPPSTEFMAAILGPLAKHLRQANMSADTIKAGCGRCGACSSLKSFEEAEGVNP